MRRTIANVPPGAKENDGHPQKTACGGAAPDSLLHTAMKMLLTTLLAASTLSLASAATDSTHMAGQENKSPGFPGYTEVSDHDKAMDHAMKQARHSLGFFIAAMRAARPGDSGFEVKKAFVDGNNVEHLWISALTYDGHVFHGKINNKPMDIHNQRFGDTVTVAPAEVSDWMFIKGDKLIGGFTTRVLYARLSPDDRAQFDKKADFKIQ
jgi:uncharacterized protein YegJ (DUF2314 family)